MIQKRLFTCTLSVSTSAKCVGTKNGKNPFCQNNGKITINSKQNSAVNVYNYVMNVLIQSQTTGIKI